MDYLEGLKVAYRGASTTLTITAVAVIIGIVIGLIVAICKISKSKVLKTISTVYVELLRGTPLVVQALILYFGIPQMLQTMGVDFKWASPEIAAFLACGLNSSAYIAEIIRAGLQAIDKGQTEAARSLGMTNGQNLRYIIIPQAFKVVIPALGNEFITLIKETAVLSVISVVDITRASMMWASSTFVYWPAYIGTAVAYLTLTIPLSLIMNYVERRMNKNAESK